MTVHHDAAFDQIASALAGVDLAAPSTTKFSRLETTLAALAGLEANEVVAATISKAGNFSVRATQSKRAQAARLFVGVVTDPQEYEATRRAATTHVEVGRSPAVLLLVRTPARHLVRPLGGGERTDTDSPLTRLSDVL